MPDEPVAPAAGAAPEIPQPSFDLSPRVGTINLGEAANKTLEVATPQTLTAPVAEAPKVEATPPPAAPKTEDTETPKWTVESLLNEYGKDLKPGDPRLQNFGHHKDFTKKVVSANEAQALRITELEARLAEAPKTAVDPSQDRLTFETELAALKSRHETEVQEYREWKSKQDLTTNETFRREYDGRRVELLDEAQKIAAEIQVDPEKIAAVFDSKSELQLTKALKELDIDDEDAQRLIHAKASEAIKLSNKKADILSGKGGKSITEMAAEYKAHLADFGNSISTTMTKELQGQLLKATESASERLVDKSVFFKTEQGKLVFEELQHRFRQGYDLDAEQVVDALSMARVAPIFERRALEQMKEIEGLKKQLAFYEKGTPGALSQNGGAPSGAPNTANSGFVDPFAVRTGISLTAGR